MATRAGRIGHVPYKEALTITSRGVARHDVTQGITELPSTFPPTSKTKLVLTVNKYSF